MAAATKADQIGFKQAVQIGQMPAKRRLDFIAEASRSSDLTAADILDRLHELIEARRAERGESPAPQ